MKLIIDIPEEVYKQMISRDIYKSVHERLSYKAIQDGTPIPDNATNGQVIRTLFKPNRVERTDDDVIVENYDFNKDWWNAPYKAESGE